MIKNVITKTAKNIKTKNAIIVELNAVLTFPFKFKSFVTTREIGALAMGSITTKYKTKD